MANSRRNPKAKKTDEKIVPAPLMAKADREEQLAALKEVVDELESLNYPVFLSKREAKKQKGSAKRPPSSKRSSRSSEPDGDAGDDARRGHEEPRRSSRWSTFLLSGGSTRNARELMFCATIRPIAIIVSNDTSTCEYLRALDMIPKGLGDRGEMILTLPMHALVEHESARIALERLLERGAFALFDERDPDAPLRSIQYDGKPCYGNGTFSFSLRSRYVADDIDQDLLFALIRDRFLREVEDAWQRLVVRPGRTSASLPISSIEQSVALASLMTLGRDGFSSLSKRAKTPEWKTKALRTVDVPSSLARVDLVETSRAVDAFSQIKRAWIEAADVAGIRISMTRDDLAADGKADDEARDDAMRRFRFLAGCLGIDAMLDAMDEGIPIEDLLCGGLPKLW